MSLGRPLLITFALLAYLGQSLAFAQQPCDSMADSSAPAQHVMVMDFEQAMDSEHMHHDMAPQQALAEHGDDCCGSQCQCADQGCHSPIPAVTANNDAPMFRALAHGEPRVRHTISTSFYLYKPPILS